MEFLQAARHTITLTLSRRDYNALKNIMSHATLAFDNDTDEQNLADNLTCSDTLGYTVSSAYQDKLDKARP